MRQTIGMSVGGTTPTKIIVNGTTLNKCTVNGTNLIKTYYSISLSINFLVNCSAFSYRGHSGGSSCGETEPDEPDETVMYVDSIKITWSASGDKTISSISIAPVVELKDDRTDAVTTTYGTRVRVTSGQTITPATSRTEAEDYTSTIDFRCQLKSQVVTIYFTDETSVSVGLGDFPVQSDRKSIIYGWADTSFTFDSGSLIIEWEV